MPNPLELETPAPRPSDGARLLTTAEAAALLSVSVRTIWRYIDAGRLKARRLPGGQYRIAEAAVLDILASP